MTERSCQGCGVALPPMRRPGRARKWCSEACRIRAGRADGRYVYAQEPKQVTEHTCRSCGAQFTAPRTRRYCTRQCRPSMAREARREADRRGYAAKERGICSSCGADCRPGRTRCKACFTRVLAALGRVTAHSASEARSRAALRRRLDAWLAPKPPALPVGPKGLHQQRWAARRDVQHQIFVAGPCGECGTYFMGEGRAARYCSDRCLRRARIRAHRQRRGKFAISTAARLAIYERDAWTCQLCMEHVDPELHYLDDMAATLDHIECQSWSLIPNHQPSNLRLTHRRCNTERGDEGFYLQAS